MIQLYRFSAKGLTKIDKDPIKDLSKNPRGHFWLDLKGAKKEEVQEIAKALKIHSIVVKAMISNVHRARLEEFPDYILLIMHTIELDQNKSHFIFNELDIVANKNFIITCHRENLDAIKEFGKRLYDADYYKKSPGNMLYHLLDLLIDAYDPHFESFERRLEVVEGQLFRSPDTTALAHINHLKKEIARLRRLISPQKEVFNSLGHNSMIFTEDERLYLRYLYSRLMHVVEHLDSYHEITIDFMGAYLSLMSNKMNEVMKILTIFATIMMPLTFITGVYGMNFQNMPELYWESGYYIVLLVMALLTLMMLWFFKRKRWM